MSSNRDAEIRITNSFSERFSSRNTFSLRRTFNCFQYLHRRIFLLNNECAPDVEVECPRFIAFLIASVLRTFEAPSSRKHPDLWMFTRNIHFHTRRLKDLSFTIKSSQYFIQFTNKNCRTLISAGASRTFASLAAPELERKGFDKERFFVLKQNFFNGNFPPISLSVLFSAETLFLLLG